MRENHQRQALYIRGGDAVVGIGAKRYEGDQGAGKG